MNGLLTKIRDIAAGVLEVDPSTLDETTEADAIESWDSLRHLAIITAIEEEFRIQLSMDVIAEIDGMAKLEEAVSQALATA